MRRWMLAAAACVTTLGVSADEVTKTVGSFMVSSEEDKFGEGTRVVALASSTDGLFALRCLQNHISVALSEATDDMTPGDVFVVKFRADRAPVIESSAVAINKTFMQLDTDDAEAMFSQVAFAKEVAFRVTSPSGATRDYVFALRFPDKAVDMVRKGCVK